MLGEVGEVELGDPASVVANLELEAKRWLGRLKHSVLHAFNAAILKSQLDRGGTSGWSQVRKIGDFRMSGQKCDPESR